MKKIIFVFFYYFKVRRLIAILFCSLIFIVNCYSQWQHCDDINEAYFYSLANSGNYIYAGGEGGVWISTNSGQNWIQSSLNNHVVFSIAPLGSNIFAGINDYQTTGGVSLSTNNGQNWIWTSLSGFFYSIAISGNYIYAGDGGLWISSNNGQNWTYSSVGNGDNVYCITISGDNIFAGTQHYGIYLSTNNGQSWVQRGLNNQSIHSIAVSGNNIYAGTELNGIYLSTNYGLTWAPTSLTIYLVSSIVITGNNVIAGTYGVWITTNNGSNWVQKNDGFNTIPHVNALLVSNNYLFAATSVHSVWRRPLSEVVGIKEKSNSIPKKYSLYQNYPNPFNPVTKIKFDIPQNVNGKTLDVKLLVYDILGKEITTLVNEQLQAGTYEVTFDGGNLQSGVYFYQLRAGNYTETKKLILMK